MALGSITNLGVGSGFELQDILDQLREVDSTAVNIQKSKKTELEQQVTEFDSINAKLIQMKSNALSLSLESNFLERSAQISDEDMASASVISGTTLSSYNLEIKTLATKSSWESIGFEDGETKIYAAPSTDIASSLVAAVTEDTSIGFTIGTGEDQKSISLDIKSGSTLSEIAAAINSEASNLDEDGNQYVNATVEPGEDGYYIRLSSVDTNTLNDNRIQMTSGPAFLAADFTFSHQTGSTSDPIYVAVPPNTTYADVVSLINDDPNNTGLTAALIDDGSTDTPWHLTFTANETGEDNRIFLQDINMTEVQGAEEASLNASFSIDGFDYQRQTNDGIDDVIQGITLNLDKVGETQLTIGSNTDTMKEKITDLINVYNELIQDIAEKTQYDTEAEENGILSEVYSVKAIGSDLAAFITNTVDTGTDITSLMDLGLELNKDGTLTLDENALSQAFSSSADDVAKLFIGDSDTDLTGLGDFLNDKLKDLTSSTGILNGEKSAAEAKIDRLTTDIESAEERLDKRYDLMAQDFVRLDALIGTMNAQSQYLTSVIDSFNNSQSNN